MKVNGQASKTIRALAGGLAVEIIDQTALPFAFERRVLTTWRECVEAIALMRVRGAPLIGVTGAWAMALATKEGVREDYLRACAAEIAAARPTAVNLSWAVGRMLDALLAVPESGRSLAARSLAAEITDEDEAVCRAIGRTGAQVIEALYEKLGRPVNVLTHCNAGWLATVDNGTALSPVFTAHDAGVPVKVWVEETRPRNQGLLTAWELREHGIEHTLLCDNAGGHLMQHGLVDLVIVGADRITRTGDTANKIGTYLKALAARDCGLPFYVAAPASTFDGTLENGLSDIEIEERSGAEVRFVEGTDEAGRRARVRIAPDEEPVTNPAFDVTPARLITGFMTEKGLLAPGALAEALFGAQA